MILEPTVDLNHVDCIEGIAADVPENSVHLVVTSIPFEELFTYSGKLADVGNNGSTVDIRAGRFALNLRFVVQQLLRVLAPGCNCCIHIQQLLAYKNQHGFMGRRDFRGAVIDIFRSGGFRFTGEAATPSAVPIHAAELRELCDLYQDDPAMLTAAMYRLLGLQLPSEVAIPKDPQQMAQRLNLHSLQFKTGYERGACLLAPAPNDYVLIFTKPGECENRVRCIRSASNPDGWITTNDWIKWAKGTWSDIQQTDVLDGWKSARETDEERHVCPLQLGLIYRLVQLYTNPISIQPDVTVLDPFMGIGSTACVCIGCQTQDGQIPAGMERNVIGFELKDSYYDQSRRNVDKTRKLRRDATQADPVLF